MKKNILSKPSNLPPSTIAAIAIRYAHTINALFIVHCSSEKKIDTITIRGYKMYHALI